MNVIGIVESQLFRCQNLLQRFLTHSLHRVNLLKINVRVDEVGIQGQRLLTLRQRRVVFFRVIKRLAHVRVYGQRSGIEREGPLHFVLRVNRAAGSKIICGIPLMGGRIIRTELKSKFELALGFGEIPQPQRAHKADGRVRFAKLRINFQRLPGVFFRQLPIGPVESVTIRQTDVSQRKLRIFVDRFFKKRGGLKLITARAPVPQPEPLVVIRERLRVCGEATGYCCVGPLLENEIARGNCAEKNCERCQREDAMMNQRLRN